MISGALGSVARVLFEALRPLDDALRSPTAFEQLLRDLGYEGSITEQALAGLDLATDVGDLVGAGDVLIEQLDSIDVDGGDLTAVVTDLIGLGRDLLALVVSIGELDGAGLDPSLADPGMLLDLGRELPGHLLVQYLEAELPILYGLLRFCGVIVDVESGTSGVREVFDSDQLAAVAGDPVAAVRERYGWGQTDDFQHGKLLDELALVFASLGHDARTGPLRDQFSSQFFGVSSADMHEPVRELVLPLVSQFVGDGFVDASLVLVPVPPHPGDDISELYLTNITVGTALTSAESATGWSIAIPAGLDTTGAVGVRMTPTGTGFETTPPNVVVAWTVVGSPPEPWHLLGGLVEVGGVELTIAVSDPVGNAEIVLACQVSDARLVVDLAEGDSFLRSLAGSDPIDIAIDAGLEWSSVKGLSVAGGVGLDIVLPLTLRIGPMTVSDLHLAMSADGGTTRIGADVDVAAAIGPLAAAISGIGVEVVLVAAPSGDGSLGPLEISVAFKPPDGIGIGIDVGVVSGGGYLDIDAEAGTYEGIIDIDVLGVGVSAVVIIETDVPGVDGWSMFFALFIGLPSIQLGFGFTLTGVGGVAGINRTLDPEALGAAVRSGSLDAVLFPDDPIAEAPLIIDTFKAIFPAENDRVVFGPIVRIAWGTPTLVEAELGIVLSLPDPIVIAVIGSVTAILPTPDVDLVAINLDIGGVIDFEAMSLTLSASLHDSHVVGFALSGDMELRANFGCQPSFLMSLGGFHPDFVPPAGFPSLNRLRLALSSNPYFNISFECYLALTSNTVQFGAALDIDAEIAGFGIAGGASFDALVQFTPFMLRTDLGFYITVTAAGIDLAGVWLDVSVDGPNPWGVDGVARFQILGFEEQIDVHEIIGTARDEPSVAEVDPFASIIAALSSPDAWTVVSSPSGLGVTLASSPPAEGVLLASPESTLAVGQRVAPLGIDLDHIGNAPIGEHTRFEVEARPRGIPSTGTTVDWFAPANYFDLSPIEAMSGPSFEQLTNGITLGGGAPTAGTAVESSLEYEQILRDPEMGIDSLTLGTYDPLADVRPLAATAHSSFATSSSYAAAMDDTASLADAEYAVVDAITGLEVSTNTTMNFTTSTFTTWSSAHAVAAASVGARTVITPTWELAS